MHWSILQVGLLILWKILEIICNRHSKKEKNVLEHTRIRCLHRTSTNRAKERKCMTHIQADNCYLVLVTFT